MFINGKAGHVNAGARRAVFGELSNFAHKPAQTKVCVFLTLYTVLWKLPALYNTLSSAFRKVSLYYL